jgi:hypothetical protein
MRTQYLSLLAIFILLLGLGLTACGDNATEPSWMFVVNADEAALSNDTLTLAGVSPQVIAFTDRPDRLFGSVSMEELADVWAQGADSFEDDPPNAIVDGTTTDADGTTTQCAVEVELVAAPVPGELEEWTWEVLELARFEGCPEVGAPIDMQAVSVFIDAWTQISCGFADIEPESEEVADEWGRALACELGATHK